jgi:hypothetical protein
MLERRGPGNVRLRQGEAGRDRLGVLGEAKMRDVLKGLALLFGSDEVAGERP